MQHKQCEVQLGLIHFVPSSTVTPVDVAVPSLPLVLGRGRPKKFLSVHSDLLAQQEKADRLANERYKLDSFVKTQVWDSGYQAWPFDEDHCCFAYGASFRFWKQLQKQDSIYC